MASNYESDDPVYDSYELVRKAHDLLKWVAGFQYESGPIMRNALIDRAAMPNKLRVAIKSDIEDAMEILYEVEKALSKSMH